MAHSSRAIHRTEQRDNTAAQEGGTPLGLRVHAAMVIAQRELQALVRGTGGYPALAIALVTAAWLLSHDLEGVRSSGLLVHDKPFQAPLMVAVLVLSVFLSLSAVVSVARERERGTMEILFYGPVDEVAYISGKLLGQVAGYVVAIPVLAVSFWLFSLLTGLLITQTFAIALVVSVVPVGEVVAFGLLLSALAGRLRTAILLLFAAIVLFLGITMAYSVVSMVPIDNPASPMLPVRNALGVLDSIVDWISPFAYLERALDGVSLGAWSSVGVTISAALGHTLLGLGLAWLLLRRSGVRARGE